MSVKKQVEQRDISNKRIQEIENYLLGINSLVNPNMKDFAKRNPIAVKNGIEVLKVLQEEMKAYHIDINRVDLEAIYEEKARSQEDNFICNLNNGITKAMSTGDYKAMLKGEQLEQIYPKSKRKSRIKELQELIEKESQIVEALEAINPSLAKDNKNEIQKYQKEVEAIEETLSLPTRDYVRRKLYSAAAYKLENLKEQCENKLTYLEGLAV